jgi:co-chaperonin GroES (HSP10)
MSGNYKQKFNKNGVLETVKDNEVKFEMPTRLKTPGFIPEGKNILLDIIPLEGEKVETESLPGRKTEAFEITGAVTESGIITSASAKKDRMTKGLVVAVGTDVTGYSMGDVVIYYPNPAVTHLVEVEGEKYLLTIQANLVGKYTNYDLGFNND